MKANFKAINPNDIEMELVISMKLRQWVKIKDALKNGGEYVDEPFWSFIKEIRTMIEYAEIHFRPDKKNGN